MIKEILGKREAKIIKAKYLHVGVKPEIAKIFADSQMVSGMFTHIMFQFSQQSL